MDPVILDVIYAILGIIGGSIVGKIATDIRYKKGKKILGEIRKTIDHVDDAVYDDKITEEEFRGGWEHLKGLFDAIMT